MMDMEMKTLMAVEWHFGIPDGEEKIQFILDDIDYKNEIIATSAITQTLVDYGVRKESISFEERETYSHPSIYICEAEIGRFDERYHEKQSVYTSVCRLEITFTYVWEHRGDYFECKPIDNHYIMTKKS
jgi:hypothetical protein